MSRPSCAALVALGFSVVLFPDLQGLGLLVSLVVGDHYLLARPDAVEHFHRAGVLTPKLDVALLRAGSVLADHERPAPAGRRLPRSVRKDQRRRRIAED